MTIVSGCVYMFEKSGNIVRAIAPLGHKQSATGATMWTVERVTGDAARKRMTVNDNVLVSLREQN